MWIDNSRRRVFFDMHLPDWDDTNIASDFQPQNIAETFSKSEVDSVVVYAKCQYGNFYYDTKLGHKHSGLGEQNLFREMSEALHEKDIKVIAYYSVSWDEWVSNNNKDWLVKGSDGTSDTDEFRWQTLCINSPYRQLVMSHIKEIMEMENPDGFWIDMTIIGSDKCHCKYCKEKFKQKYGYDMPVDKQDENYDVFMKFRYDYIEEFYRELRELVKGINNETIITNNYWGYPYSTATMGSRAVGAVSYTDFVTGEAYTDWTGLNAPSFFTKFLRGVAKGKPYEAVIGRFYNTWDYTVKPYEQMAFETYSVIANGAVATIDDEPYHDGKIDEQFYEDLGKIFSNVKRREKYLKGNNVKYAAIFHSQQTKDYFNDYGNSEFIRSIAGSFKMLRDLHYPIDFIFDDNADYMNWLDYSIIIMPSVAVVSTEIINKLKEFVEKGGTLIMAGQCMLYTIENDKLCKNTQLMKEYFDIDVADECTYSMSYMDSVNLYNKKHVNSDRPILVKGKYANYKKSSFTEVDSIIIEPICETSKEKFYHNNLPSPYKTTNNPAIGYKSIGLGNVICFAQPIFSHYAKQSQVELRKIVDAFTRKTAGEPVVTFECVNRMDVAVWERDKEIIIHMLNPNPGMSVCCGYMDPFEGAYPRTFEYMDEIIPVYNSKIIIDKSITVESVESVGEHSKLDVVNKDGKTIIDVEKIDLWETISIKLR
ncbi:beta-galactosidase [Vallitalea sp.]|jgi:hypothetical protein|uniref:beta-galactosidase n=1 Tax=Vallitalea sp. TaxID=1882829 RepID=UPI0025D19DF4|nr:beta-galactosidase [Vallitalea sp.]MCT4687217.1 beta-galactosidase [Vallitalea sp.]